MKTGIVVLNYNDVENTIKFIQQIENYQNLTEIVIVDNCSTDDSIEKIKPFLHHSITLIESKENKGYSYGNNLGLKYLENKCDLVFISNPDILVKEEVLNHLIEEMKKSKMAIIAPVVEENNTLSRGWKCPSFWSDFVLSLPFVHTLNNSLFGYKNDYYKGKLSEVEVVKGCFFLVNLKDFKAIDYFDEHTFLYYEENIIGKKLKNIGKKTFVDNQVKIIHELSQSVDKSLNRLKKYKILKMSQAYYQKKYNHLNILGRLILFMLFKGNYFGNYIYIKFRGGK